MLSLSLRISWRFFVPNIFRRVVWASSLQNFHNLNYCNLGFCISDFCTIAIFYFRFYIFQLLQLWLLLLFSNISRPCWVMGVLYIGYTHCSIWHPGSGISWPWLCSNDESIDWKTLDALCDAAKMKILIGKMVHGGRILILILISILILI